MEKTNNISSPIEKRDNLIQEIKNDITNNTNESSLQDTTDITSKEKVELRANLAYIQRRINNMNIESMSQVYKIIEDHNERYTETKTDILINLGNLNHNCINDIMNFIEYLDSNQELLLKDEIEKNDYKNQLKN
tara:strand:+ start:555 stop:956 length:402 start_codon:yes stop_codon:yes gene_type:complete